MKLIAISDTHNRHKHLTSVAMGSRLSDGDLLIHAGDLTSVGYKHEVEDILGWFNKVSSKYTHGVVFIAGNHDRMFENHPEGVEELLNIYFDIDYLQDEGYDLYDLDTDTSTKIYGSPLATGILFLGIQFTKKWNRVGR